MAYCKIDTRQFDRVMKKAQRIIRDPQDLLKDIATEVIIPGIREQFATAGQHWGTPWAPSGKKIEAIRKWQGIKNYKRTSPLVATKFTQDKWTYQPIGGSYQNGIIVGSLVAHVVNLHEGTSDGSPVTFKKLGSDETITTTFPRIPAREIIPESHGFRSDEIAKAERIVKFHIEQALR